MEERLRAALRSAMRSRDLVAIAALRSALGALDNATAVPVEASTASVPAAGEHVAGGVAGLGAAEAARRELTPAEAEAVVRSEVTQRRSAAEQYPAGAAADRLRAEADVLAALLP